MAEKTIWQRPFTWLFTICCLIFIILIIFTLVNDKFYRIPLAQVTDVKEVHIILMPNLKLIARNSLRIIKFCFM